jgi:hypothetical protein
MNLLRCNPIGTHLEERTMRGKHQGFWPMFNVLLGPSALLAGFRACAAGRRTDRNDSL